MSEGRVDVIFVGVFIIISPNPSRFVCVCLMLYIQRFVETYFLQLLVFHSSIWCCKIEILQENVKGVKLQFIFLYKY